MKFGTKLGVALSALFLMTACETPGQADGANGSGVFGDGVNGENGYGNGVAGYDEFVANVGDRVFFATDSSTLNSESQAVLSRQATWLKSNSAVNVVLEGHCDERGTREYNLALGERRANATRNYLVNLGVAASRISVVSYGKERPAVLGSDGGAWAQNRRAVTVLSR
jgi:peptidoglycan-associated lipoprotein